MPKRTLYQEQKQWVEHVVESLSQSGDSVVYLIGTVPSAVIKRADGSKLRIDPTTWPVVTDVEVKQTNVSVVPDVEAKQTNESAVQPTRDLPHINAEMYTSTTRHIFL